MMSSCSHILQSLYKAEKDLLLFHNSFVKVAKNSVCCHDKNVAKTIAIYDALKSVIKKLEQMD